MSQIDTVRRSRGRLQLLLLATLFLGPLLAAYVLYFYFPDSRPQGTTNYGELVSPARPLPPLQLTTAAGDVRDESALKGRWSYVHVLGEDCDRDCLARLVLTRQARTAMNEKRQRVQRVALVADSAALPALRAALAGEHPDLVFLVDDGSDGRRLQDFLGGDRKAVYLLDPLGTWLMTYRPGTDVQSDFKGLQKDLGKLLRLSQIG